MTRKNEQKSKISYMLGKIKGKICTPCTITMVRYGKRLLDAHDNLPISFKYILDTVCAFVTGDNRPGRGDGYPGLKFVYAQEKSKDYFIRIVIDFPGK